MGEGWHNNHHAYQSSARQGFRWWEVDATYYILKALSFVRLVRDLKTPPAEVLRNEQRLGSRVVNRAAEELVARFNPERIALAVSAALHSSELAALREALDQARHQMADVLASLHPGKIPTRDELLAQAQAMFARTRSLDEIVDRAHQLLLGAVGSRLIAAQA
jgi:stearoyl-CoA desaturase (Delta-9 desaturase)